MTRPKAAVLIIIAAVSLVGATSANAQEERPGDWAATHCSGDAVRSRYSDFSKLTGESLPDETTLQGLFILASAERECVAAAVEAAAEAAKASRTITDHPWTTFCSEAELRLRHPGVSSTPLRGHLWIECRGSLQAASDAAHEFWRCRYSSVSECLPDLGCFEQFSAPAPDEEWIEVPSLNGAARLTLPAVMDWGPWPVIRRCNTAGCVQLEVEVRVGGGSTTVRQRDGTWFVRVVDEERRDAGRFLEVAPSGLRTRVYYGSCPLEVVSQ